MSGEVTVIAKIIPKNNSFTGLMDAKQLIGDGNTNVVPSNTLPTNTKAREITFALDGNGQAIASGGTWYLATVPFAGTITGWNLVADQSGSIVIDVWKANGSVPTVSNTITAANLPTLSSAQSAFSGSVSGWTTAVAAGDTLAFHVNSATTVQKVSLTLLVAST